MANNNNNNDRKKQTLMRLKAAMTNAVSPPPPLTPLNGIRELRQILNVHVSWLGEKRIKKAVEVLKWILNKPDQEPDIYENVLWALCNLTCESKAMAHLVNSDKEYNMINKVSLFVRDIYPNSVRDQAIWTLSNYAADCENCRYEVRKTRILLILCKMLEDALPTEIKRKSLIIWTMRNYVRPVSSFKDVDPLFRVSLSFIISIYLCFFHFFT